jgi:formylglycine-generating enzyme required for sulfatase activity
VDLFDPTGYKRLMLALNEKANHIKVTFKLQEQYLADTPSDELFVQRIAATLKPISIWEKIIVILRSIFYKKKPFLLTIGMIGIFIVLFWVGSWAISKFNFFIPTVKVTVSQNPVVNSTSTIISIVPSTTLKPNVTSTKTQVPIPGSLPTEVIDIKGAPMALVPAGEFTMGNENGDSDEQPVHQVYLDAYYIDKFEVTNALYKACVNIGGCSELKNTGRYKDLDYKNYPVVFVDWNQAITYCKWRGGGLPTEAQWEKAARGTDGRTYPWGEGISCSRANYRDCISDTNAVGSYVGGVSLYGAYDMAGNVWEWVQDWYSAEYYVVSPNKNPLGPKSGTYHVVRGGAWDFTAEYVTSSDRFWGTPDSASNNFGFRCAKDATP